MSLSYAGAVPREAAAIDRTGVRHATIGLLLVAALLAPGAPGAAAGDPCAGLPVSPYLDVDPTGTHARAIDCGRWYELILGTGPDTFDPAAPMRRDQLASLLARLVVAAAVPLPAPDRPRFDDLDGNVHRDAVERLAEAGIVEGRSPRTYDPYVTVRRGQMTAFLVRTHRYVTGHDPGPAPDAFTDDDGHRHEVTIDQAAALGLASGRTATTFAPDDPTTRAETASFLARLLSDLVARDRIVARPAGYRARVFELSGAARSLMTGRSWRPGCPVALDDLRLVELVHASPGGPDRWGLLVVHRDVASDVADAFGHIHDAGFGIRRMELVDRYGADDDRSMAADNTSAFNCRHVEGTTRWSEHAYGRAVDINPIENPWVRGNEVDPPEGAPYRDRSDVRPGMIVDGDAVVRAFTDVGWGWGGHWRNSKDYQHLSATGN